MSEYPDEYGVESEYVNEEYYEPEPAAEEYYEPPAEEAYEPEPVAEEPVEPEPVAEEPVVPEPVEPEPVAEEPVEPEPEPVAQEPVVPEPVEPEPVAEETLPEEEYVPEEPVADEPVAEDEYLPDEEPTTEEPVENESVPQEPVAEEESASDEPPAEEEYATEEEYVAEDEPLADEPVAAEAAYAADDTTAATDPGWGDEGAPEDWETWTPPVEPSPDSWMSCGCSTDWGVVEADWAVADEPLLDAGPATQPLTSLIGPGHAADVHWADQGQTNYCGLYSVRSILSELGHQPDVNEMVDRAAANGWLVYEGGEIKGIRPEDLDDILNSYGVGSHNRVGEDGAWQALNDSLVNGQRMVIGLDAKELDAGTSVGDDPFTGAGVDMDHFVAVTGIDYERGVVIVNDSARGAGLEIPVDLFYESWRDSGFSMTVTDGAVGGGESDTSFAALGMTLHPDLSEIDTGAGDAPATEEPVAWDEAPPDSDFAVACCGDLSAPAIDSLPAPAPAVADAQAPAAPPAPAVPATHIEPTFFGANIVAVDPVTPSAGPGITAVDPIATPAPAGPVTWAAVGPGTDDAALASTSLAMGGFVPGAGMVDAWTSGLQTFGVRPTANPNVSEVGYR